jgi:hypothetical protein
MRAFETIVNFNDALEFVGMFIFSSPMNDRFSIKKVKTEKTTVYWTVRAVVSIFLFLPFRGHRKKKI